MVDAHIRNDTNISLSDNYNVLSMTLNCSLFMYSNYEIVDEGMFNTISLTVHPLQENRIIHKVKSVNTGKEYTLQMFNEPLVDGLINDEKIKKMFMKQQEFCVVKAQLNPACFVHNVKVTEIEVLCKRTNMYENVLDDYGNPMFDNNGNEIVRKMEKQIWLPGWDPDTVISIAAHTLEKDPLLETWEDEEA